MVIEFTKEEAGALLQLIDVAIKAVGLNGAEAGVVLAKKIDEASKASETPKTPEVSE